MRRILALTAAIVVLGGTDAVAQEGVSYSVPRDNPFVATPGARPEVYSLGLRNPYRFSFDRTNGYLTIADVGGGEREEVDWLPRGRAGAPTSAGRAPRARRRPAELDLLDGGHARADLRLPARRPCRRR